MSDMYRRELLRKCGPDVYISDHVEIRRPHLVDVGSHVVIDHGFYCTTALDVGDYVHIAPYVTVIGGQRGLLRMAHFSTIAAGGRMICGGEEHLGAGSVGPIIPERYRDTLRIEPVVLEMFANVGTNVVVLPGVVLREGTVIGAGSVVTKSTEPWMIYAGVPARPIKPRFKETMLRFAKELGY